MSSSSASLSPPSTPNRSRAHSTNLRPALTLNTLGRRRSTSFDNNNAAPAPPPLPSSISVQPGNTIHHHHHILPSINNNPSPPSSMLAIIASRLFDLFHHVSPKHSRAWNWSTPSSPRTEDEYILPMSASSQQTTFGDVFGEKELHASNAWRHPHLSIHTPILLVIILFPLSTALVLLSLSTLPISVSWPRTLTDVATLGRELHGYSQSGPIPMAHVLGVLSITSVWKHAWSIPGSVIWNVLAGALFSPALATLLLTALTMVGSVFATLLSKPLAPFLTHFFPRALELTRGALEGGVYPHAHPNTLTYVHPTTDSAHNRQTSSSSSPSSAWVRLSVLRLIGVVPWSGINIASGVCGVALGDCMLGAFIGTLPWTAVTCQIGDILHTITSTPSPSTPQTKTITSLVTSPEIIFKLVFLSFLSLAPILARDHLRALISPSSSLSSSADSLGLNGTKEDMERGRMGRWTWVQDWRSKIRLPSRSRTRTQTQTKELEVLIREKQEMEMQP